MPRGGARPGSGRKPGSKNKPRLLSENIAVDSDAAAASEKLILIAQQIAHDPNASRQERLDAIKVVTPYLRARIGVRTAPPDVAGPKIESLQIIAIPSGCFPTNEQLKNPNLLPMDQATPVPGLERMFRPKPARVYTPPAPTRTIIGSALQAAPREIEIADEPPDDIVA